MKVMAIRSESAVDKFITRWHSAKGSERANYQLFVHELCTLLERLVTLVAVGRVRRREDGLAAIA